MPEPSGIMTKPTNLLTTSGSKTIMFRLFLRIFATASLLVTLFCSTKATAGLAYRGQYTSQGYGLVYDSTSKVTWTQYALACSTSPLALDPYWGTIQTCVNNINASSFYGLVGGWRLPTINELANLYNQLPGGTNKTGTIKFGSGTNDYFYAIHAYYWSDTYVDTWKTMAYDLNFALAKVETKDVATPNYVWLVRNGDVAPPAMASISVSQAASAIRVGQNVQFSATGTYSDGSTANITNQVVWSSSSPNVATINSAGVAISVTEGTTKITATFAAISASKLLTVQSGTLTAIDIQPETGIIKPGFSIQLRAKGTYTDGTIADVTNQVQWTSSNTNVTTISSTGLAKGVAVGETITTASFSTVTDNVQLSCSTSLLNTAPQIAAGSSHSLAITADGTLYAWGDNQFGQLGNGSTVQSSKPMEIGSNFVVVSAGNAHSLAITSDGTLWAWGSNSYGKLGDGTTTNRTYPTPIGNGYLDVAAGYEHSLGLKADGTLWAWGWNGFYQLGDGTQTMRNEPTLIGYGFKAVSGGTFHTMALKQDGTLWAWGGNSDGQLGDGTTTQRKTPFQVGSGFSAVSAGRAHTLAVRTDGTLWAWGDNGSSDLGDGTTVKRTVPTQIGSGYLTPVGGWTRSVALKQDGTLWAWGLNNFGQVGDGTTTTRSLPQRVGNGNSWRLAAASSHTLAMTADGTLWAWGKNDRGQLGTGNTTNALSPVAVLTLEVL